MMRNEQTLRLKGRPHPRESLQLTHVRRRRENDNFRCSRNVLNHDDGDLPLVAAQLKQHAFGVHRGHLNARLAGVQMVSIGVIVPAQVYISITLFGIARHIIPVFLAFPKTPYLDSFLRSKVGACVSAV